MSFAETVAAVDHALATGTRGYVVTPNVDHLVEYERNASYRAACDGAWLRLADGMPIVWASHVLGRPLPARVAGSDLLPALCRLAAARGHSIFLLGGQAGVAERAAARLTAECPGLRIAGLHAPPAGFDPDGPASEAAVAAVNAVRPALLFLGLGTPKQEVWLHRRWDRLGATVAICCGAAIDFAAGVQIRAPRWMRDAGLEWAWRLGRDPRRLWKRYLVRDAAVVGIFLKEWRNARNRPLRKT